MQSCAVATLHELLLPPLSPLLTVFGLVVFMLMSETFIMFHVPLCDFDSVIVRLK